MNSRVVAWWEAWWFSCEQMYALGIFRIAFGVFLLAILVVSFPNWERFYGPDGIVPFEMTMRQGSIFPLTLFSLSGSLVYIWFLYGAAVTAAFLFTAGYKTRVSSIAAFLIFASLNHRNPLLLSSQDMIMLMLLFFSCFAPLGRYFSLDEVMRRFRSPFDSSARYEAPALPAWGLRLMQVGIANVYVFSFFSKVTSDVKWRDGTAIYFVTLSDRWFRFPRVEIFHNHFFSLMATYGTLIIEALFPVLVWFKQTRWVALAGVVILHGGLFFVMSQAVLFFSILMIISFTLFIPSDAVASLLGRMEKKKTTIFYDGACALCRGAVHLIKSTDLFNRLDVLDICAPAIAQAFPQLDPAELRREMYARSSDGTFHRGFWAFRRIAGAIPLLWPLWFIMHLPGAGIIGPRVYAWVARNRFMLFPCKECGACHEGTCKI